MEEINKQVKSKERVTNHGEVFTSEREVNKMLDLVKDESERTGSSKKKIWAMPMHFKS